MPGGGQLALVAVGAQNTALNGNPDKTLFYQVIQRHTHFAAENIGIQLDGPNELMPDQQIRLRAKIPRHADLLTGLTFVFQLPAIYSKIWMLPPPTGQQEPQIRAPSFRWIHQIGAHIIASASIYISGTKVQEFPGEWIAARATCDYTPDAYQKWRNMVGDVPELTEPEWGIYGRSTNYPYAAGIYPHNVWDPSGANFATAPSIPAREIRVPLPFWFTETLGHALPLVSLQLHEVEVQLTLRSLHELYRINDPIFNADPCRPGQRLIPNPAWPTSNEPTAVPPIYDNLTLQNAYASWNDPIGTLNNYFQPATANPMTTLATIGSAFNLNASLEGQYIYVTEREQAMFAERALQTPVRQVQQFTFPSVVAKTRLDLDVHGPLTRLIFLGRRSDAIQSRNDYVNCSNWKSLSQAPFWPIPSASPTVPVPNSGRLINYYSVRDTIQSVRLLVAGNELYEEKDAPFYELWTPFATASGQGVAGVGPATSGGQKPDHVFGPLYQFPFALQGSNYDQPTGTLNASRIREVQLEIAPTSLDPNGFYVYDVTVFAETINFLRFQNGMGGLVWAV